MAEDQDVLERIERAVPERPFEVPTTALVYEARRRRTTQRGWIAAGVVAIAIAVFIAPARDGTTVAGFTVFESGGRHLIGLTIPSGSMTPTLRVGDIAAVDLDAYVSSAPTRGDIIVFTDIHPTPDCQPLFVKRVVGVAGDVVEEIDGAIYVNGELVEGPVPERRGDLGPWAVDPGRVFVVGDHLANSNDSRYSLGQIPLGNVVGRVDLDTHLDPADVPAPPACTASVPASTGP